jgi:hypothetical protein
VVRVMRTGLAEARTSESRVCDQAEDSVERLCAAAARRRPIWPDAAWVKGNTRRLSGPTTTCHRREPAQGEATPEALSGHVYSWAYAGKCWQVITQPRRPSRSASGRDHDKYRRDATLRSKPPAAGPKNPRGAAARCLLAAAAAPGKRQWPGGTHSPGQASPGAH